MLDDLRYSFTRESSCQALRQQILLTATFNPERAGLSYFGDSSNPRVPFTLRAV